MSEDRLTRLESGACLGYAQISISRPHAQAIVFRAAASSGKGPVRRHVAINCDQPDRRCMGREDFSTLMGWHVRNRLTPIGRMNESAKADLRTREKLTRERGRFRTEVQSRVRRDRWHGGNAVQRTIKA